MTSWNYFRRTAAVLAVVGTAVMGLWPTVGSAQDSTWQQVKDSGELRFAVFNYPPYFVLDRDSGEWGGALVAMAEDVAAEMKVELVPVEVGGWSELVLALTTNRVDMAAGMQATPVRATAIDFAGPIYWIEWVTVNRPGFEGGDKWSDYNHPDVDVAVMTGTSDQLLLELRAPNAGQVQFRELSQIILAVSSGRADAFTTTVLSSMIAHQANPGLGTFNRPTPRAALPGYFGIRSEIDPRFKNFLNWWSEWNILLGHNDRRMREAMIEYSGIEEIPEGVTFAP